MVAVGPPAVTIHDDNYYTAVQPGRTHVVCDSSAYDFDVRQAARIALSATREAEDYIQAPAAPELRAQA